MKVDEAKKIADAQIERLAAALQQGKSDALKAYLSVMSRFHHYSFRNLLLIFSQRPEATHVAGFNSWKNLGRFVKKGEKGITIFVPIHFKKAEKGGTDQEEDGLTFRAGYVFDVSQTDGEPLPEFAAAHGDPGEYADRLKAMLAEKEIKLEYSKELGTADGVSKGGTIILKEGLPPAQEFSVMVHELAHEILHHDPASEKKRRSVRETEAEAVAFVVSEAVGLETSTASTDYIQLYSGDGDMLKESLASIQKAAAMILSAVLPEA